ncbi:hypothetical protein V3C99_011989 [Haemonchus contortus]
MASEKTPLVGQAVQERPAKRFCHGSPTLMSGSLPDAVDLFINDDHLPAHLKTILGHFLDNSNRINELLARNRELETQLEIEISENNKLRKEVETLKEALNKNNNSVSSRVASPNSSITDRCEEKERLRSVVIAGICESSDVSSVNRVLHDVDCVKEVFHFLNIGCSPTVLYRLGEPRHTTSRLLKVAFPSRFFVCDLLKKAPKLRFFSVSGIFVRRSLPKSERERLSALRKAEKKVDN